MIEKQARIETSEGLMGTFICHPEEGGPHPVVFFYMDAPGKREELILTGMNAFTFIKIVLHLSQ